MNHGPARLILCGYAVAAALAGGAWAAGSLSATAAVAAAWLGGAVATVALAAAAPTRRWFATRPAEDAADATGESEALVAALRRWQEDARLDAVDPARGTEAVAPSRAGRRG